MKVTVLTPAYNRDYIIERLYKSLVMQTYKNFEWLVIDDGSTDKTENKINEFIREDKIKIRYFKQQNGGKHRALNKGISLIRNEVTFIVDSDDYLLDNAIEEITKAYEIYNDNPQICGYSFLRCFPDMKINGDSFRESPYVSDYITCRLNEGISGDKAEAYLTKCLKEFPFLEVEGENFLFEDYVWIQMAEKYKTIHFNIPIYMGNYLEDGLTKNIDVMKINNPIGMMQRSKIMESRKCNILTRIKAIIMYISYGRIAQYSYLDLYKNSLNKGFYILLLPVGILFKNRIIFRTKLLERNRK